MRSLSMLAIASLMIGSVVAKAVVIPGWECPIKGATLTEIVGTKPVAGMRANYLTMNQQDGSDEATSFTLHEDTGIRCITAPCPSTREVQFDITEIDTNRHGTIYTAVEVLKNIPPHVRIARRTLKVTESSMELVAPGGNGFMQREVWEVQVKSFPNATIHYYGYPEALASIATN